MLFCFDNVTFFPFLLFLLFFVFLFFFVLFLKTIPIGVQQSTWREFLVLWPVHPVEKGHRHSDFPR